MSSFGDQIAHFSSNSIFSGDLIADRILMLSVQVRTLALVMERFVKNGLITVDELNSAIQSVDLSGEIEKISLEMYEFMGRLRLSNQDGQFDC